MNLLFALAAVALGGDALTMEAVRHAQEGHGAPSITFHTAVSGHVAVRLTCGGRSFRLDEAIRPGGQLTLELGGLPLGAHRCSGELTLSAEDGTSGAMPLSLDVEIHPPLTLSVSDEDLDLDGHRMRVHADRPLSHVAVRVLGPRGVEIGSGELGVDGRDEVELEWVQQDDEALKLVVTATDVHALSGQLDLSPWSYAIPHEDVVFATNSAEITDAEAPKLESAYLDLQAVLAKYGDVVETQLFVAGYTDTVGSPDHNQALSERRAQSIATWFAARGYSGAIHYQGFGESVLAVTTTDNADEAANRRAIYVVAADKPPISEELPRQAWRRLATR